MRGNWTTGQSGQPCLTDVDRPNFVLLANQGNRDSHVWLILIALISFCWLS